ncbi:hypothetical protein [Herbiconiux liangxiaofengii]|uniref:hypothetical protein n=1 Tax=Herbiconiux liangxiaofengii TaxID=3342795 RepID=UPI0035B9A3E0
MIHLTDNGGTYALLLGLAAMFGAFGGLVYELLLTVNRRTGSIELPTALGKRHIDLGVFASVIVGAVAAVAALWVFPPDMKITVDAAGKSITSTTYDVIKLAGLSLIVGSAGGTFLAALQSRALLLVTTQKAKTTSAVASEGLQRVRSQAEAGATNASIVESIDVAVAALKAANSSTNGDPTTADF